MSASPEQTMQMEEALRSALLLMGHYAKLLNAYDGGSRRSYDSPEAWMARLYATKRADAQAEADGMYRFSEG